MKDILLLEPNPLQADLLMLTLARHQFKPHRCPGVEQLSEQALRLNPSLLLMELSLPGANALDLLETLQANGSLNQTRVILLSAIAYPEVVQRAARLGVCGFLAKPLDLDALVERVRRCLADLP